MWDRLKSKMRGRPGIQQPPSNYTKPRSQSVHDVYLDNRLEQTQEIVQTGRKVAYSPKLATQAPGRIHYSQDLDEVLVISSTGEPFNLITSMVDDGFHLPVFDIDLPVHVVESSTPGCYHLYIDRRMSLESYKSILRAFVDAGVIEQGYYDACAIRGYGVLRAPHIKKADYWDRQLDHLRRLGQN